VTAFRPVAMRACVQHTERRRIERADAVIE